MSTIAPNLDCRCFFRGQIPATTKVRKLISYWFDLTSFSLYHNRKGNLIRAVKDAEFFEELFMIGHLQTDRIPYNYNHHSILAD